MDKNLKLSVHQLVDFLLRNGDIDNRVFNKATMGEGIKIHTFYQKAQKANYIPEYYLCETFNVDDFVVTLDGRADGVIEGKNFVAIDEIKSTIIDLDDFYKQQGNWHLGQAKCYALMYTHLKCLDQISIYLTYIHQLTKEKKIVEFLYTTKELEEYVNNLINQYLEFYKYIYQRKILRNKSAIDVKFPFSTYRSGQKKLAKYVYSVAKDGGTLFCEAPTGIGKTISTLYPSIKTFSDGYNEKIFYLTAKNSGKEAAFNTVNLLLKNGLIASDIVLTAKEKMCFCNGKACNPDECIYTKDYYSKLRNVLMESIKNYNEFSKDLILSIAYKNKMCPFELSLDLSLFVDIIICDYNYFFDPQVYLKRFFDEDASKVVTLIDEAHNLPERGRDMYSSSISFNKFKKARKSLSKLKHQKYKKAARKIAKMFENYSTFEKGNTIIDSLSLVDCIGIDDYLMASIDVMKHHHEFVSDEFMDFYFELNKLAKLFDYFDESFVLYVENCDDDLKLKLLCLNPRAHLLSSLSKTKGNIIFSATMSPISYYLEMIGGSENSPYLKLPSPFKKENLCLMVAPKVSIKYKNRDATLQIVSDYLSNFVKGKVGNYLIYVPSYAYLEKLLPYLSFSDANLIIQEKGMNDDEKLAFLSNFVDKPNKTVVGLSVLGGAFSEGVDLVNERLIGVAVIGVGLPQICFEREQIKQYFEKKEGKHGFKYSYIDPGMNKVMQAVGRLIRTEKDRGVALLIDERYATSTYRDLFKEEWKDYKVVTSPNEVEDIVEDFWDSKKNDA